MRLRHLRVRNFRNLVDVAVPISDTTILVGENNAGKTAFLDVLKAAIPKSAFGRAAPFEEYDYHMSSPSSSPKTSDGIVIEMTFREDQTGEWPKTINQSLAEIIQLDPQTSINFIILRITSKFDAATDSIDYSREFLDFKRQPLVGKAQSSNLLNRFLEYVRFFYLSALRDCDIEFSAKSQFWGRILRDLKISDADRKRIAQELATLNDDLLKADPRLAQVRASLETLQKVVAAGGTTSIQALPMKPWDFLSKSEVVIQSKGNAVDFPLKRHGQGIQSLAVLFLFQAYVDVLLKPTFQPETEAILALEEPEAHLHPQAARALTAVLGSIAAQKIISTHSPYVLQGVPIKDLRLFRKSGINTTIHWVGRAFTEAIPSTADLTAFCAASNGKYQYKTTFGVLRVSGTVTEDECREILKSYAKDTDAQKALRRLQSESRRFLSDAELADLDTFAKRIRGEIFFARGWLLCEGQSEFMLLAYFAELLGQPLDQHGISIIDFQNNGSPTAFVKLAVNLAMPFVVVCDDDPQGKKYVASLNDLKLIPAAEFADTVRGINVAGADLEAFLIAQGFLPELEQILIDEKVTLATKPGDAGYAEEVAKNLRSRKTGYTLSLIQKLRDGNANAGRVPKYFADAIQHIITKAQ